AEEHLPPALRTCSTTTPHHRLTRVGRVGDRPSCRGGAVSSLTVAPVEHVRSTPPRPAVTWPDRPARVQKDSTPDGRLAGDRGLSEKRRGGRGLARAEEDGPRTPGMGGFLEGRRKGERGGANAA